MDRRIFDLVQAIIDDAEREGDLRFPAGTSSKTLTLTLIALVDGLALALRGSVPLAQLEIADPVDALIRNVHVLFDGYGWRPLSGEWDYQATERRIATTLIKEMALEPSPKK